MGELFCGVTFRSKLVADAARLRRRTSPFRVRRPQGAATEHQRLNGRAGPRLPVYGDAVTSSERAVGVLREAGALGNLKVGPPDRVQRRAPLRAH
jgi:hypothetical protein